MDYGISVGDRVRPADTFDFAEYGGPEGPEDVGTVVHIEEPDTGAEEDYGFHGLVHVRWDSVDDEDLWDHTTDTLRGGGVDGPNPEADAFMVVKV